MSSDSENFETLRRLLALKRHEQPPPAYFNNFSRQVMGRLRAGEAEAASESLVVTWWRNVLAVLESKPIFAGGFGAAICALLISGVINSERAGMLPAIATPVVTQTDPSLSGATPMAVMNSDRDTGAQFVSLSNNAASTVSALFNHFQLSAQPASASFVLPGGGN